MRITVVPTKRKELKGGGIKWQWYYLPSKSGSPQRVSHEWLAPTLDDIPAMLERLLDQLQQESGPEPGIVAVAVDCSAVTVSERGDHIILQLRVLREFAAKAGAA